MVVLTAIRRAQLAIAGAIVGVIFLTVLATNRPSNHGGDGRVTSRGEITGTVTLVSAEGLCVAVEGRKEPVCGSVLLGPGGALPAPGDTVTARLVYVSNPGGTGYGPLLLLGAR